MSPRTNNLHVLFSTSRHVHLKVLITGWSLLSRHGDLTPLNQQDFFFQGQEYKLACRTNSWCNYSCRLPCSADFLEGGTQRQKGSSSEEQECGQYIHGYSALKCPSSLFRYPDTSRPMISIAGWSFSCKMYNKIIHANTCEQPEAPRRTPLTSELVNLIWIFPEPSWTIHRMTNSI